MIRNRKVIKRLIVLAAAALLLVTIFISVYYRNVNIIVFSNIKGTYEAEWNDELEEQNGGYYEDFWALYIGNEAFLGELKEETGDVEFHHKKMPYFSCYDSEAGNPGFEGRITELSKDSITIEMEKGVNGYYDSMPFDWEPEGGTVKLELSVDGDYLNLSSKGKTLTFRKDGDD